jgi:hypothetical protein
MVRLGVSLPALMQMLGHKDINLALCGSRTVWICSGNFIALAKIGELLHTISHLTHSV